VHAPYVYDPTTGAEVSKTGEYSFAQFATMVRKGEKLEAHLLTSLADSDTKLNRLIAAGENDTPYPHPRRSARLNLNMSLTGITVTPLKPTPPEHDAKVTTKGAEDKVWRPNMRRKSSYRDYTTTTLFSSMRHYIPCSTKR
jgi:hypothetical protein